jgi:GNAT superfamily N-acetyltransferase
MKIEIRKANILDHSKILFLLLDWFDELKVGGFPPACGYTGIWLAHLISDGITLIAETEDRRVVGCIGLKCSHFGWNNEVTILANEFLMTDKEYRQYGIADMMMNDVKKLADESKTMVLMGHMTANRVDAKDKFLSKHGFVCAGSNFIYGGK